MKRLWLFLMAVIMLFTFVACTGEEIVAQSAVESMLEAMTEEDYEKAEELTHPIGMDKNSLFYDDWGTMCTYLKDCKIEKLKWQEYTTIGNKDAGKDFEESGILEAKMSNGLTYKIRYTYLVRDGASGFTDFHLNHSK